MQFKLAPCVPGECRGLDGRDMTREQQLKHDLRHFAHPCLPWKAVAPHRNVMFEVDPQRRE